MKRITITADDAVFNNITALSKEWNATKQEVIRLVLGNCKPDTEPFATLAKRNVRLGRSDSVKMAHAIAAKIKTSEQLEDLKEKLAGLGIDIEVSEQDD